MKLGRILGHIGGGLLGGALGFGQHGNGPMQMLGGMSGMGGYLASALQHKQQGQAALPTGAGPMQPHPMPGQMGPVSSPMQPIQAGQAAEPTSFGQPTGMFGAGGNSDMLQRYRQMLMSQYGGGY